MDRFKDVRLLVMDFDGVIGKSSKWWGTNGIELKEIDGRDAAGIDILRRELSIPSAVISNCDSNINIKYCDHHGIIYRYCSEDVGKDMILLEVCSELDIDPSSVCYIGDDVSDICALNIVGFPVVVNDCHDSVGSMIGVYRTNHNGGSGAVREVCDMIYSARTDKCPIYNRKHIDNNCSDCISKGGIYE